MNKGILYSVATPIGNLEDISQRALRILNEVAYIAAEDTRESKKLLHHFGVKTPLISLHEHNERARITQLLEYLQQGKSIALISDAGTPLVSDPGQHLVIAAHQAGIQVTPIPGASAAITALSAGGLPADTFIFAGFLPAKSSARKQRLTELKTDSRTLIFYEAPHRILELIDDMIEIMGTERYAVIAKELTKMFETIHGDKLGELKHWLQADPKRLRGEFVVLVKGNEETKSAVEKNDAEKILKILMSELPLKQAVALTAKITGEKKNAIYKQALKNTV